MLSSMHELPNVCLFLICFRTSYVSISKSTTHPPPALGQISASPTTSPSAGQVQWRSQCDGATSKGFLSNVSLWGFIIITLPGLYTFQVGESWVFFIQQVAATLHYWKDMEGCFHAVAVIVDICEGRSGGWCTAADRKGLGGSISSLRSQNSNCILGAGAGLSLLWVSCFVLSTLVMIFLHAFPVFWRFVSSQLHSWVEFWGSRQKDMNLLRV